MAAPDYIRLWADCFHDGYVSMSQYQQESSAKAYDASVLIWKDGYERAAALPFAPEDTVLDIGCGPGVLSVPLASRVRHVTALDASSAMLALAKQHAEEKGLKNISYVESSWQDADPSCLGTFDNVIASYSLGMPDIAAALLKMNVVAQKSVILYWFNGMTTWEKIVDDLGPSIHGGHGRKHPKADLIYGALSQLGISADVTHLEGTSFPKKFQSEADAIQNLRGRLGVQTAEYDHLFRDYLLNSGVYQFDGEQWIYVDRTNYVRISWKPVKRK